MSYVHKKHFKSFLVQMEVNVRKFKVKELQKPNPSIIVMVREIKNNFKFFLTH